MAQLKLWIPDELKQKLKDAAKAEDTSMSWLATAAIAKYLKVNMKKLRGYEIPKTFTERKSNPLWTPNKGKKKGGDANSGV